MEARGGVDLGKGSGACKVEAGKEDDAGVVALASPGDVGDVVEGEGLGKAPEHGGGGRRRQ